MALRLFLGFAILLASFYQAAAWALNSPPAQSYRCDDASLAALLVRGAMDEATIPHPVALECRSAAMWCCSGKASACSCPAPTTPGQPVSLTARGGGASKTRSIPASSCAVASALSRTSPVFGWLPPDAVQMRLPYRSATAPIAVMQGHGGKVGAADLNSAGCKMAPRRSRDRAATARGPCG